MYITYKKLFEILNSRFDEKEAKLLIEYIESKVEFVPDYQEKSADSANHVDIMVASLSKKIDHAKLSVMIWFLVSISSLAFLFRYL
ncbi:MAG: hypothetical protein JXA72_03140 [Bacteroidales bacterium]|nr:hypothetical protein [Bacteroidales bacterium]